MAYVITQGCCNDASCAVVCPVDCIHPTPDEAGFAQTEMLYIDPDACIDCGACVEACPVSAIVYEDQLTESNERYADINASYYAHNPALDVLVPPRRTPSIPVERETLRVAIVGSGPAGCYAAQELMAQGGTE